MAIIGWLLVGLIAGAIARLLVPGRQPLGLLGTILLGLVGSLLGGFIGSWLDTGHARLTPAGLLGSIIGAVIALVLWQAAMRRRGRFAGFRRW